MLQALLIIVLLIISIAILCCIYRVIIGPSMTDRVLALDSIGINLISSTAVVSILLHTTAFVEVILVIGILSFVGTTAFAKFLERGVVLERNRNRNH